MSLVRDCDRLYRRLESSRQTFIPLWQDLANFILPRRPRFLFSDVNKGERRASKIIDSTATMAARSLRSAMMSMYTSPSRPWFRFAPGESELMENLAVSKHLHECTRRSVAMLGRTNIYNQFPIMYGDMSVFATSAMLVEEDDEDILRFYALPVGSYLIGVDSANRVNLFAREFSMTPRQMEERFGLEAMSLAARKLLEGEGAEEPLPVRHVVMPSPTKGNGPVSSKPFVSVYYEAAGGATAVQPGSGSRGDDERKPLGVGGHTYFPVLVGRWEVCGEDAWGTGCPGMLALGDIKQLQTGERRTLQGLEKNLDPALQAPGSLRTAAISQLPGAVTYHDSRSNGEGIRPIHEVKLYIREMEDKQEQVRGRIRRAFHEDVVFMMLNSDRREITAREIDERHDEKLTAFGPVIEQINQDVLDPLIDIVFHVMQKRGLFPEPPEELAGRELKVEYISMMNQAQKLVGIGGIERLAQFTAGLAPVSPEVFDKVDTDSLLEAYADMASVPPGIIRPDDVVEQIRSQRQQAQQAQQQAEMMKMNSEAMRNVAPEGMPMEDLLGVGV